MGNFPLVFSMSQIPHLSPFLRQKTEILVLVENINLLKGMGHLVSPNMRNFISTACVYALEQTWGLDSSKKVGYGKFSALPWKNY